MSNDNKVVHFLAGGAAGVAGGIVTCPLDVAKTRLQSSLTSTYVPANTKQFSSYQGVCNQNLQQRLRCMATVAHPSQAPHGGSVGLISCLRHIIHTEGYRALFKGLGPTLVGVAPSRAIYFGSYNHFNKFYSGILDPSTQIEYSKVNLLSAASAGFICTTSTNPIWMIRTRLQLNNKTGSGFSTVQCIRSIYEQHGVRGFYKGLVASYFGIIETSIHFVLYEALKKQILENRKKKLMEERLQNGRSFTREGNSVHEIVIDGEEDDVIDLEKDVMKNLGPLEFLKYTGAAAVSKTIATCIAYPHEVVRTRLREENSRYRTFFGTIMTVFKEEGYGGLYRGLGTQLIKHIPNTAIIFVTYEATVYIFRKNGF